MNITGIICEYNPFHNGHALHIAAAREATGAACIICAMSGGWTQRGEPAIADKWTRARSALMAGADLVIELPTAWALRAAGDFARGGVGLLNALGVCTYLCFGSELPIEALREALERGEDTKAVRLALARGRSYPRAVAAHEAAALPNATLGIEYLRSLAECQSPMLPVAIRREVPHDAAEAGEVTSASRIRAGIGAGEDMSAAMPGEANALLIEALRGQGGPAGWESLTPIVLRTLRGARPEALRGLHGVNEGLENRILRCARAARSVGGLFDAVKCKRYTHARIRRAVAHAVLGISPEVCAIPPGYARVLGFRRGAEGLLRRVEGAASIPLITKLPAQIDDPMLAADIAAQELWALACPRPLPAGMDYTHPIAIV